MNKCGGPTGLYILFLARPVAGHPGFSRPFGAPAPWAIHISALRAFIRATGLVFYQFFSCHELASGRRNQLHSRANNANLFHVFAPTIFVGYIAGNVAAEENKLRYALIRIDFSWKRCCIRYFYC